MAKLHHFAPFLRHIVQKLPRYRLFSYTWLNIYNSTSKSCNSSKKQFNFEVSYQVRAQNKWWTEICLNFNKTWVFECLQSQVDYKVIWILFLHLATICCSIVHLWTSPFKDFVFCVYFVWGGDLKWPILGISQKDILRYLNLCISHKPFMFHS